MTNDERIDRLARRRAAMKMGWFIHAGVYVAVNLMLATLAFLGGRNWAIYPAMGWGLGLLVHGVVVFLVAGAGGLQERLVEGERRKLRAAQEPW
jgi:hypothetical protein